MVVVANKSKDGKVRGVEVSYKNPKPGESVKTYRGGGYITVERPVQRLVVIVQTEDKNVNF